MNTNTTILARIKERLDALGLSERAACLKAGVSTDAIRTIKNGHSPKIQTLAALADALEVTPNYFLGEGPMLGAAFDKSSHRLTSIPVTGSVEAGTWRKSAEWPRGEWFDVVIPRDSRFPGVQRFGLLVAGKSMDKVFPDGCIVIVALYDDIKRLPRNGEFVVAIKQSSATSEYEISLKEYERDKAGSSSFPS